MPVFCYCFGWQIIHDDKIFTHFSYVVFLENKTLQTSRLANAFRTSTEAVEDDDAIKQAAVKIQATYRGFRARKSIQISASAATKIQAHFRGYKVRKSVKRSNSLNDLSANSNSSSCSNVSGNQHPDLEKHVTKIQAGVRGYLVRKRHSLQNSAAMKIQTNYRRYKSRKMSLANPQPYRNDIWIHHVTVGRALRQRKI